MNKAYIHLPCLVIQGDYQFVLSSDMVIRNLSAEEYLAFDKNKEFYASNKNFRHVAPVILEISYNGQSIDKNEIQDFFYDRLKTVYLGLLLIGIIIPNPLLTVSYFTYEHINSRNHENVDDKDDKPNTEIYTALGPLEREWIMKGSPINYDYAAVHDILIYNISQIQLIQGNTFEKEINEIFNVLESTSIPEFWSDGDKHYNYFSAFVNQIAVLENILFPEKNSQEEKDCKNEYDETLGRYGLTNYFAFNLGVLAAKTWENRNIHFSHYKKIYQLRSKIIHGEIGFNANQEIIDQTARGRNLLCNVILILLRIGFNNNHEGSLPLLLSKAYNDQQLFNQLSNG
ncbi:hypothetical protein [Marinigracilibium pacificum]|uniref:Apea-like HEPN domain-containing protein n=1 Tax=Marinigracilibium pacificum TaxID=2729599 RepID=A0A848J2L6_9BACT|nr:hypothetical protein [Marinigracilibium pacificum]NMM50837.1 hypothetical protein [Marinigracilibium pacificum]